MNLINSLFQNIFINFDLVTKDYVGLSIDTNVFVNFALNSAISLILLFVSYLFGDKLRHLLFKETSKYSFGYLISVALGYILIATGIGLLGFLSLLSSGYIMFYAALVIIFALCPKKTFMDSSFELLKSLKSTFFYIKSKRTIYIFTILFVLLAGINLINPEIREDQYHVDFPRIYLSEQTIMIPPREVFHVSGSPMLSEMYYTIGIVLYSVETTRYIHFLFYVLVILTLFELIRQLQEKYFIYAPLIFITAPVVIHETSSAYVDFEWMLCFLLSLAVLFLNDKMSVKKNVLIGILLGGMLATKLWTIVFIPAVILYMLIFLKRINLKQKLLNSLIVALSSLFVVFIWFLRSFILTGNPLYPAFSKAFTLESTIENYQLNHYLSLNYELLNPFQYINAFSPLVFIGTLLLLYKFKDNIILLWKNNLFKFFLILLFTYIIINYPFGRYLLGLYVIFIFISSVGLKRVFDKFKPIKYISYLGILIMLIYYFINSILVLPYAFGISDKNKYLSRILIRDNSSYFNFDKKFNKYITRDDYVATYGIYGYYYATFKFVDINFILDINHRDFNLLKMNKATKLLIKGGDIKWFCSVTNLTNCNSSSYSLISTYQVFPTYYLYKLK